MLNGFINLNLWTSGLTYVKNETWLSGYVKFGKFVFCLRICDFLNEVILHAAGLKCPIFCWRCLYSTFVKYSLITKNH